MIFSIGVMAVLILNLLLKRHFLQIFKTIEESSPISHSIGNFTQKNFKTGHFRIKLQGDQKKTCQLVIFQRNNNAKFTKICI